MNSNSHPSLSILQITDLHILPESRDTLLGINTEFYFHEVLKDAFAAGRKIDLILLTGDLAQHPCVTSYQRILQALQQLPAPCICLPGNHDDYALMQTILNSGAVSCNRQIELATWQIVCLNSQIPGDQGGTIAPDEMTFLEHCLTSHPEKYTLIAVHHHCLPIDSTWMDTMKVENGEQLFQFLKSYPQVKVLIHGHIHQELQICKDAVQIYATPSTCFQFKPKSHDFELDKAAPGYRTLNLYSDGRVESTVHRLPVQLTELELTSPGY